MIIKPFPVLQIYRYFYFEMSFPAPWLDTYPCLIWWGWSLGCSPGCGDLGAGSCRSGRWRCCWWWRRRRCPWSASGSCRRWSSAVVRENLTYCRLKHRRKIIIIQSPNTSSGNSSDAIYPKHEDNITISRSCSRWDCETTFPRLLPRLSVTEGPFPELVLLVRTRPGEDRETETSLSKKSLRIWGLLLSTFSTLLSCRNSEIKTEIIRRETWQKIRNIEQMKDTSHLILQLIFNIIERFRKTCSLPQLLKTTLKSWGTVSVSAEGLLS